MRRLVQIICSAIFLGSTFTLVSAGVASATDSDSIKKALSSRHMDVTRAQLEQMAGGKDALVTELLTLRRDTTTPFVGVRSVKLLLPYSSEARVQSALNEDLGSTEYKGLAEAIALNLVSSTESGESRNVLARVALERAKTDKSFAPFVEPIKSSQDPEMKRIVSDVLAAAH